jgi:hypothetical protein
VFNDENLLKRIDDRVQQKEVGDVTRHMASGVFEDDSLCR